MVYHGIVCYDIVLSFVDDVVVVILSDWRNTSAGPSENLKMLPAWPAWPNKYFTTSLLRVANLPN